MSPCSSPSPPLGVIEVRKVAAIAKPPVAAPAAARASSPPSTRRIINSVDTTQNSIHTGTSATTTVGSSLDVPSNFTLQPRGTTLMFPSWCTPSPDRGRKRRATAVSTPPHSIHTSDSGNNSATSSPSTPSAAMQGLSLRGAHTPLTHSFGSNHSAFRSSPTASYCTPVQAHHDTPSGSSYKTAPVSLVAGASPQDYTLPPIDTPTKTITTTPMPRIRLTPRSTTSRGMVDGDNDLLPEHPLSFLPSWDSPDTPSRSIQHPDFFHDDNDSLSDEDDDTPFVLQPPSALCMDTLQPRKELRLAPSETSLLGMNLVASTTSLTNLDTARDLVTPPCVPRKTQSPPPLSPRPCYLPPL